MGAASFCVAATGRNYLTFDADQTAREFWQGKTPTRAPTLSEFQRYMVERIKAYFRGIRWDFWPDTRMVGGELVLFDIVLFFVDSGRVRALDYQFLYRKEDGFAGSQLNFSALFGGDKTCCRLCRDTEPDDEFEAYRAEAIIAECRSVFGAGPPLIDTAIAREYAKRLVEIASRHEYASALSTVSPTSDCALLGVANGFQWLCRTLPIRAGHHVHRKVPPWRDTAMRNPRS
jgi:hypothetical protein